MKRALCLLSILTLAAAAQAAIIGTALGTGARPTSLGGFTLTNFGDDTRPTFQDVTDVPTPTTCGDDQLRFGAPHSHRSIGSGWATWSGGYTGDVYYTGAGVLTSFLNLPTGTKAFVFYAEPEPFAVFTITATANDGTNVVQSVDGDAGARGFGFHTTGFTTIASITVTSTEDFAVGEFKIACDAPITNPTATITAPTAFSCGCDPITITGTASDSGSGLSIYRLEWSTSPNGPWTLISSSTTEVSAGTLGTWDTTGIAEGTKFLRLRVTNRLGIQAIFVTAVYIDQAFDNLNYSISPVVGDTLCLQGTCTDTPCFENYIVDYRRVGIAPYTLIGTFNTPVINSTLATFNTNTVPDGTYEFRVRAFTTCGNVATLSRTTIIDNTLPVATITSPVSCTADGGIIPIRGTASDANIQSWTLQYSGGPATDWVTLATGVSSTAPGALLANWNTAALPRCAYSLRLLVTDRAVLSCGCGRQESEDLRSVGVSFGALGDLNCDGAVNFNDIDGFVACLVAGGCTCP